MENYDGGIEFLTSVPYSSQQVKVNHIQGRNAHVDAQKHEQSGLEPA